MMNDLEYLIKELFIQNYGELPHNSLEIYMMDNIKAKDILVDLAIATGIIDKESL